jgi:hypothetical protein
MGAISNIFITVLNSAKGYFLLYFTSEVFENFAVSIVDVQDRVLLEQVKKCEKDANSILVNTNRLNKGTYFGRIKLNEVYRVQFL